MKLLLVTIRKRAGSDEVSKRETILEGSEIHIGRAVSMEICLPDIGVDYQHATVEMRDGKLMMKAAGVGGIKVDGADRDEADLGTDSVKIGRFTFRGEPARDGADAVMVMEEAAAAEAPTHKRRGKRQLENVLPSRRMLAWVFSLAIIGVFLGWPMYDVMQREAPASEPIVVEGMARTDVPKPTIMEIAWTSGPISQAHSMIENDCAACHQRPFEMTTNNACLACHATTQNHADTAQHPVLSLENSRCASCHKEHNGGLEPTAVAETACFQCHSNIQSVSPNSKFPNITDFDVDHPPFKLALVQTVEQADGMLEPQVQRVTFEPNKPLIEQSGLKFPHNKHLQAGGVKSPRGMEQLNCASCHEILPGGKLMRTVDMERDCARCHQMTFNAAGIERTLPHANEDEVARILENYYIAAALEGGVTSETAPEPVKRKRKRRIAGQNTNEQRAVALSDNDRGIAIEWARREALVQMDTIFGVRLCGTCHEAQKFPDEAGVERWRVQPALIQRQWMVKGGFAHDPHKAMECTSCHEAPKSERSNDVLMPDLASCQSCHKGSDEPDGARAECVTCHEYHIDSRQPMSPEHAEIFHARASQRQQSPKQK
ncbi:MAG: cytochrome c3 family protein [Pseudomonadota bacterium]